MATNTTQAERAKHAQMMAPIRQQPQRCRVCGFTHRSHPRLCHGCGHVRPHEDTTATERITSLADVPAVSHMRTFDRGNADITEAFLSYLCPGRRIGPVDWEAVDRMFGHFMDTYPSLGITVFRHLHWNQLRAIQGTLHPLAASNREQARERGISHHTIETELAHGRTILEALAIEYQCFL